MRREDLTRDPVRPIDPVETPDVASLLDALADCSFQGRNLGRAFQVWRHMVAEAGVIFMGMAGAMVPAGMRQVVVRLIQGGFVDCLVTTGANLFHDAYETLGTPHWKGDPDADDEALNTLEIDRFYDTYGDDGAMRAVDRLVADFAAGLSDRPYTTREFFYLWGQFLSERQEMDGILTAAFRHRVPIYVPAIADSSYGIALAVARQKERFFLFDGVRDAYETSLIASENSPSGAVYFGGGTPKNFIQQSQVIAEMLFKRRCGHAFAIQVTADAPHWGGLSGCTIEESISWGKVAPAALFVNAHADATIAMPLMASALVATESEAAARRERPQLPFEWPDG
jgi:deoxyhypusine synthase